jgi:prolipoprotein diacylglyceryltransferase
MQVGRVVSITSVIYLIFVFAFASGAIHALTEGSRTQQQFLLVPDRSTQTMTEAVLSTMIFFFGLAGIYFIHRSAKPQTAKSQKMLFIAGFAIMAIALLAGFMILEFKVR